MNLYDRDYKELTESERETWRSLNADERVDLRGMSVTRSRHPGAYPKAMRHHGSLFPNNYLDIMELRERESLEQQLRNFEAFLGLDTTDERAILRFINDNGAYFIVASLLRRYFHFGHHGAYVFPEFQLGTSFKADYLLIGKASGGHEFAFVELESPLSNSIKRNGALGDPFRKGLHQVQLWDYWIEAYFPSLRETFDKQKKEGDVLPEEFTVLDTSRIHYAVVAGRRAHFKPSTYRDRRKRQKDRVHILHYDNLVDSARSIIESVTTY